MANGWDKNLTDGTVLVQADPEYRWKIPQYVIHGKKRKLDKIL